MSKRANSFITERNATIVYLTTLLALVVAGFLWDFSFAAGLAVATVAMSGAIFMWFALSRKK
ncbi:positive regulator of sigma E activity [Actinoplanes octamycinicus]|uniref:Positive regulator of sigma E activity n=1 Tax=Actinoplanes octamycinicus TaxID=135948 RepID=A0A7W7GSP9_9ACTN|nr:hypothetical protein [Actinoplanes octamycinicus]MBB4737585.1 positive regulator of sigma E activity [Actinoplanes octamycinicus]GIE57888.1 hypothetical protein Aoc01nite_32900 [Actinoplanes octamycinicus]